MASADFSRFVVTACHCGLALETSPVMDAFFPSYTRLIYSESSEQLWDFVLFGRLIHSHKPSYQVSVRRVRCLPTASFRFHLAMDTLAFGCSLPTVRAAWGLAPVSIRSCWANHQKRHIAVAFFYCMSLSRSYERAAICALRASILLSASAFF